MELNLVIQGFLGLGLATIMFGVGLTLGVQDFARVFEMPKAVLVGLLAQLVGLPLAAVTTLALFDLPLAYGMGLLIIATSPGGPTSNLFSFLARADVALSVTLTALSSTLTLVTIPIILGLASHFVFGEAGDIRLPTMQIVMQLFLLVLTPISAGMLVRAWRPAWAKRRQRPTATLSVFILVAIIAYVLHQDFPRVQAYMGELFPSLFTFVFLALGLGIATSLLTRVNWKQTKTIMIEIGIQNGAQAMVIATGTFGFNNPQMGVPAALYSVSMYLVVSLLFVLFRALDRFRR